ncbi:hypothetical protein B5X24_HaOG206257 [Helicoverpa armigera]|nr:hypothetical protein B5X24_HaOG206257 [Helicoverpa armigera]
MRKCDKVCLSEQETQNVPEDNLVRRDYREERKEKKVYSADVQAYLEVPQSHQGNRHQHNLKEGEEATEQE